jgi:ubiquinone/menaquinone biosynthesis C-methylase UbiE
MGHELGLARGKVFPAARARSLLNPLRRVVQSPRRTVARCSLTPAARVLEIGPGPGFFSAELVRAVPAGQVVLLDLQIEMLRLARRRLEDAPTSHLVQGDASSPPFRSATFDAALVVLVLGEVPDRGRGLNELRRLLRPGARVLFAETRRDSDFIALPELRRLVEPRGFAFLERRGFAWEYTARFVRT